MLKSNLKDGSYNGLSTELEQFLCQEAKFTKKKANTIVAALKELYETRPWRLDDIADFIEEYEIDLTMEQTNQFIGLAMSIYNACPNKFEFDMGEYMIKTQAKHQQRMAAFREPPPRNSEKSNNNITLIPRKSVAENSAALEEMDNMSQKDIVGLLGRIMSGEASQADLDLIEAIPGLMDDMDEFKEEMGEYFTDSQFLEAFEQHSEMLDSLVIGGKPVKTLKGIVGKKSVAELREIAPLMGIENCDKFKKSELVKAICDDRINRGARRFFELMPDEAFDMIDALAVDWFPVPAEDLFEYPMLINSFIVAVFDYNGKYYPILPLEIEDVFTGLDDDFEEERENSQLLGDYAQAAVNLYGAIEIDRLMEMFKKNGNDYSQAKTREDLIKALNVMGSLRKSFIALDDCLIEITLHFKTEESKSDRVARLIENHDKPMYVPKSEDDFLEYADKEYYEETATVTKLEDIFEKVLGDDFVMLTAALVFSIRAGLYESENQLMEMIEKGCKMSRCKLTSAQKKKIAGLLPLLCEETRTWDNNGFTTVKI